MLVQAGFGVSPAAGICSSRRTRRWRGCRCGMCQPVSFGVYYKTLQGNPPLKTLVGLLRRHAGTRPE